MEGLQSAIDYARKVLKEAEEDEHLDTGDAITALEMIAKLGGPEPYEACPACGERIRLCHIETEWINLDGEGEGSEGDDVLECVDCGTSSGDPESLSNFDIARTRATIQKIRDAQDSL